MTPDEAEVEQFEAELKQDLPRGLDKPARAVGRDRGLSARWLSREELSEAAWTAKDGLLLGQRGGHEVRWKDDRHMLTIAGSRAGKGVSLIVPNLIHYQGSAVVIDPKGENAARTARRRGKGPKAGGPGLGQLVHVLDPFGESGIATSSFNPLDKLDPKSPDVVEDIGLFADALITHDEKGERHWTESAQALIRALILLVVADTRFANRRNLVTVRRLLQLTDPAIGKTQEARPDDQQNTSQQAIITILNDQDNTPYGYICMGLAEQLRAMSDNERGSVLSSARSQTQWLDSPKMPAVLERSDFDLGDLKRKRMTLYLCLPATRMGTHSRWLRLMIMLAIGVMERVKTKPDLPVLFVLDEFPVLGYMESVETAAGLMAGFGVKLWPIVQNIGQLMRHYKNSWETFVANAGVVTSFGVNDAETLRALSNSLGRTGIVLQTDSGASRSSLLQGAPPLREDRKDLPLLEEHELRLAFDRDKSRMLILVAGKHAGVAKRLVYFKDDLFKDADKVTLLYDPDPNHEASP